ncbi:hypothetical protein [Criblamydia sequanensis]|uniref:Conserved putative secreted protein n=1 Tax=Candidatus Criblamydia sequanensis CRIB-18 TaxID=1437425 RepID=A0A090D0D5_9BACT|nr:hypothetical protein [Criblamydia sequanensis]CDR34992.1 Conserved putative secreted protein [Criblamydia sequanensis CRIB-18]
MKRIRLIAIAFVAALQSMQFNASHAEEVQECSRELLLSYFPEPFVKNSLDKFDVNQAERASIISDLENQDQEVIKKVEEKASQKDPNPLKTPVKREEAVKLFRETLFEVFSDVMKKHGETDDKRIQLMLDDIQHQKAKYFVRCMEQQRGSIIPTPALNKNKEPDTEAASKASLNKSNPSSYGADDKNSNDDDDDDDDDDDEDDDDDDDEDDTDSETDHTDKESLKSDSSY